MSIWILEDLTENVDIQEDDYGVTKVRDHIVIQIKSRILAMNAPRRLAIKTVKAAVSYQVGGSHRINNPAGTGKFICVCDGLAPVEHPLEYLDRRQTWEYFGPWVDPPAEWNQ